MANRTGDGGGSLGGSISTGGATEPPRQARPLQVQGHYPVPRVTYLTISTEDLAGLALSSGIGSLALTGTLHFAKEAYSSSWSAPLVVGFVFFAAMTIVLYVFFAGLLARLRRRSGLTWWNIFGE